MVNLTRAGLVVGFLMVGTARVASSQSPARAVDQALASEAARWEQSATANFKLYFRPGVADRSARDLWGERLEAALLDNVRLLGVDYRPRPIRAIFVGSRPDMIEIAGGPYGGIALVDDHAIAFVTSGGRAPIKHELMHLISVEAWGMPAEPMAWASEGLGMLAPQTCAGHTIRALGSLMLSRGDLPSIETLVERFSVSSLHAYLGSASLVEYLLVVHGTPAFRVFWTDGFREGVRRLGVSNQELEEGWRQFLSLAEPAPDTAWEDVRTRGCE